MIVTRARSIRASRWATKTPVRTRSARSKPKPSQSFPAVVIGGRVYARVAGSLGGLATAMRDAHPLPMSRHDDLDLRYLHALMQINKFLSHELNNHLQGVGIQITLIGETLQRTHPGDEAAWEKLRAHARKALQAFDVLMKTTRRHLATTSP